MKKHSYHLVCDIETDIYINKFLASHINRILEFNAIDLALYCLGKTLRLPNSPKIDMKTKRIIKN